MSTKPKVENHCSDVQRVCSSKTGTAFGTGAGAFRFRKRSTLLKRKSGRSTWSRWPKVGDCALLLQRWKISELHSCWNYYQPHSISQDAQRRALDSNTWQANQQLMLSILGMLAHLEVKQMKGKVNKEVSNKSVFQFNSYVGMSIICVFRAISPIWLDHPNPRAQGLQQNHLNLGSHTWNLRSLKWHQFWIFIPIYSNSNTCKAWTVHQNYWTVMDWCHCKVTFCRHMTYASWNELPATRPGKYREMMGNATKQNRHSQSFPGVASPRG